MELIFRAVDPNCTTALDGFNRLMDDLTHRAHDQDLLRRNIMEANGNPDKYLMTAEDVESGELAGSLLGICFGDFCEACDPVIAADAGNSLYWT